MFVIRERTAVKTNPIRERACRRVVNEACATVASRDCCWRRMLLALCFLLVPTQQSTAQNIFPSTQYNGFHQESKFATNRPLQNDFPAYGQSNDYRSMSPDSWETAGSSTPRLDYNAANSFLPADSQWQAQSKNLNAIQSPTTDPRRSQPAQSGVETTPFQSAGFSPTPAQRRDHTETQIQSAPNVPTDIRRPDMTRSRDVLPLDSNSATNRFPETKAELPRDNFPLYPLHNSDNTIIRAPQDDIPSPPPYSWYYPDDRMTSSTGLTELGPSFRTDLGHRAAEPTTRNIGSEDYGQKFDFEEKKKQYPSLGEIFATGRYFGSASALYLKPSFTGNTAIGQTNSGSSDTFDFDYEVAPQFQIGFESKYGPGVELTYWQYDEASNPSSFTSNGAETGTTSVWMRGASQWSRLSAANAGETLSAVHALDVESVGAMFFKEVELPISRVTGKFGMQHVSVTHDMQANLTDGGSNPLGSLRTRSDLHAYGPQLKLEYVRPVGHTKIEFMTDVGVAVLFGKQDQLVVNSASGNLSRIGADEFLTILDFFSGVQYRKLVAEKRYWFVRGGFTSQSWLGGGTAILPQDDFGLRGFAFSAGYNR